MRRPPRGIARLALNGALACALPGCYAAMIGGEMESPRTTVRWRTRSGKGATWFPSTTAPAISCANTASQAAKARAIAVNEACKMFRESISSASTDATPTAQAPAWICEKSASRFFSLSFFESASPGMKRSGCSTTAAATTGPASGPLPTSSRPGIRGRRVTWICRRSFERCMTSDSPDRCAPTTVG